MKFRLIFSLVLLVVLAVGYLVLGANPSPSSKPSGATAITLH